MSIRASINAQANRQPRLVAMTRTRGVTIYENKISDGYRERVSFEVEELLATIR
jgi:hypothetical protein